MKVAINGFGRIGRLVFKLLCDDKDFDVVAINDLGDSSELAYLLKYDTNYGSYKVNEIGFDENSLYVGNKKVNIFRCMDPKDLPWKDLGIDLVFECSGKFTKYEDSYKHIEAGCKKVIISAPGKGNMKTIVYNVNHEILDGSEEVISAASCTTNCLAPVLKLIEDKFKIEKGFMTTVHAYTNDQVILDVSHKKGIKERRGRAGALNIIPTSTGAASAIGKVIPSLEGKLEGYALRVPVQDGSVVDLVLELDKNVSVDEINNLFVNNKNETINITFDPIVSSDVIGCTSGCLVDGSLTKVVENDGKQLVKVVCWYDNEIGYTAQMIRTAKYLMKR